MATEKKQCETCRMYDRLRAEIKAMPRGTYFEMKCRMYKFAEVSELIESITGEDCKLCLMRKYPPWHEYWKTHRMQP